MVIIHKSSDAAAVVPPVSSAQINPNFNGTSETLALAKFYFYLYVVY